MMSRVRARARGASGGVGRVQGGQGAQGGGFGRGWAGIVAIICCNWAMMMVGDGQRALARARLVALMSDDDDDAMGDDGVMMTMCDDDEQ